jgi:hypothetical protein
MAQPFNAESIPLTRRASMPEYIVATKNRNKDTACDNACCGDHCHCHGCGCRCSTCLCHGKPVKDESSRETYGNEGTQATANYMIGASSVSTDDSISYGTGPQNNSWEVQAPFGARLMADHQQHIHHSIVAAAVIRNVDLSFNQDEDTEMDDHDWRHFTSPADNESSITIDDSSVVLGMDGSSMYMELDGSAESHHASMLSSYEGSFLRQSMTISQALAGAGAGAAFPGSTFLRLTPECRHASHFGRQ